MNNRLEVRVNDELVLDAGTCEDILGPHGSQRLIRPPTTTLFQQVLAYLRAKPDSLERPSNSKDLMQSASDGLALGMTVCQVLERERPRRSWPKQVLPYGLASPMSITPSRWTLTEASREVALPPEVPKRAGKIQRRRHRRAILS